MADREQRVVVLGAASWVGQQVCARLRDAGWDVTGISRGKSAFLLERLGVRVVALENLPPGERFPVVVNLAYPVDVGGREPFAVNAELLGHVRALAAPGARVVQFSSLAVFGFALDVPIVPQVLPPRRDHEYVELKLAMELGLVEAFASQELHLLRLGNVWGPGSANWVVGLANRLRAGQPVGVVGHDGFSNVTDVANVADYAAWLLGNPRGPGVHLHHLAELGEEPWSRFVGFLADTLGVTPARVEAVPPAPRRVAPELRRRSIDGLNALRYSLWDGRFTGSWYRSLRRAIPDFIRHARPGRAEELAAPPSVDPPLTADEQGLLRLLACPARFASVTAAEWVPPVALDASLKRVAGWLREAGFVA